MRKSKDEQDKALRRGLRILAVIFMPMAIIFGIVYGTVTDTAPVTIVIVVIGMLAAGLLGAWIAAKVYRWVYK